MLKGLLRLAPVAVLLIMLGATAHAEDGRRVFTGTLGKMPIVMELETASAENISGRYFYQKYRKDLSLHGIKNGEMLVLNEGEQSYGDKIPLPKIRLHIEPNRLWGDWSNDEGKTLKIELVEAKQPVIPASTLPYLLKLHESEPYEYRRLQGVQLKRGKTETFNGYSLQWWSEPQTKLTIFEIVSGYTPEARDRINQLLMGRLWREVGGYYECFAGGGGAFYIQTIKPLLISPAVISVNVSTEVNCGGAHPDNSEAPINLDAKTGNSLTLEDVLWAGRGSPLRYEEGNNEQSSGAFNAYSEYRSKEFAPWLVGQLRELYPDQMLSGSDENCAYNEEDHWQFPTWNFTENGIKLGPNFSHAEAPCAYVDWSVLPYNVVKQHPGGVALQLP